MYGYSREEAQTLPIVDLSAGVRPSTQEDALAWMRAAAAGEPQPFEWHARKKSGELFWTEMNMRRAFVDGKDRIVVVTRDITERRKHLEVLRVSGVFLNSIIELAPETQRERIGILLDPLPPARGDPSLLRRVRAEGKVNGGAAFSFALPHSEAAS